VHWALLGVSGVGTKLNHLHYLHRSTGINLHRSSCLGCVCVVSIAVYVCVLCQLMCSYVSHLLCRSSCFKMIWTQPGNDRLHTHRIYESTTINQGPAIGDVPRIICTKSHLLATLLMDARCSFDPKFVSINRYFEHRWNQVIFGMCNSNARWFDVDEMDLNFPSRNENIGWNWRNRDADGVVRGCFWARGPNFVL
jgi:hypothetical protein